VAVAWLIGNPKHIEAAMASFMIAQTLAEHRTDRENQAIVKEGNNVDALSHLAEPLEKCSWWYANLGHAYRSQFPQIDALRSAENHYRTAVALGGRNEMEVSHLMFILSTTLATVFE
jgi:hypothetical protein